MRAYLTQSHEMLFDAHYHAFVAFGGIPERGIYDNMKTAVDKVGRGKQRQVNKRFHAMVGHYLYLSRSSVTRPPAGRRVKSRRPYSMPARGSGTTHRRSNRCRTSISLARGALPGAMAGDRASSAQARSLAECLEEERAEMMPVPAAFDGFIEHSKRVSSTCLITFENNRYSVPASFANRVDQLAGLSRASGHRG
jgi:hypothetical protein